MPQTKKRKRGSGRSVNTKAAAKPTHHAANGDAAGPSAPPGNVECPFQVQYTPQSNPNNKKNKKRKSSVSEEAPEGAEASPFSKELTRPYQIRPQKLWESMKKYRNFIVGDETFSLNEFVYVNNTGVDEEAETPIEIETTFWVARVVEIRARDQHHVYLRIFWMYWPKELPGGVRDYHGRSELIASDHMDVIDAMTVSGKANIQHVEENDDEPAPTEFYWRQAFVTGSKKLSNLRRNCVCQKFRNLDKALIGCSNSKCGHWLHEDCILEDTLLKTHKRLVAGDTETRTEKANAKPKVQKTRDGAELNDGGKDWTCSFKASLVVKDKPGSEDKITKVALSDLRANKGGKDDKEHDEDQTSSWEEDVVCLACHEKID
ncbi:MAG: hypothetical protein M1833_002508 [Piccolia ochrophora]|nr:MAG: hypothetical protein M1833_002508 [Piccolia ochrophora]